MNGLALIDLNNWGFAAASTPRLCVGSQDTHAVFGILRRLRETMARTPTYAPLVLTDGKSWRFDALETYKGSRDAPVVTKAQREVASLRDSWKSQQKLVKQALELLGVARMYAFNMEADDLAAMVTRKHAGKRSIILLTADKDWLQLVRPDVVWVDLINDRRIGFKTFTERNKHTESVGVGFERDGAWITLKHPQQWSDVKALMGDPSDEIKGVGGIGEKGAVELVATYGSVPDFFNMVLDRTIVFDKLPKKFQALAADEKKHEIYYRNSLLMDLHHPRIPEPQGLKLTRPNLDVAGFREFCEDWCFQSILNNFDAFIAPFQRGSHAQAA